LKQTRGEWSRWSLSDRPSPSDSLNLLYLELNARFFADLLAESLVLFINVKDQLLDMIASDRILVKESRADAEMQGLIALLLSRALLEARSFAPESELDDFLLVIVAGGLATDLNDSLHIASLCADEPPCNLKLLVIVNLNVEPAGILSVIILIIVRVGTAAPCNVYCSSCIGS
jgi:hypothetical protein